MVERIQETDGWHREETGETGHFIMVRTVDPKFQAKMPVSGKTFIEVGPIEFFVKEIKKLLKGEPNDLFP